MVSHGLKQRSWRVFLTPFQFVPFFGSKRPGMPVFSICRSINIRSLVTFSLGLFAFDFVIINKCTYNNYRFIFTLVVLLLAIYYLYLCPRPPQQNTNFL